MVAVLIYLHVLRMAGQKEALITPDRVVRHICAPPPELLKAVSYIKVN